MKKLAVLLLLFLIAGPGYSQPVLPAFFENVDMVVEQQRFNTVASDISPVIVGNKLFYASVRETYFNKKARENKNKAFYDTYSVPLDGKGYVVSSERQLEPGFGGEFHEGPVSWCEATGELFVTLSNMIYPDTIPSFIMQEHIRLRLAIMKLVDGRWSVVEELPFNESEFNYAHPAISPTGDTLVFSSNRKTDNYGQADLYMSIRKNGQWGNPVNLGNSINTPGNEMFPTYGPGGLLLFSSDAHQGGFGQLDIYYTTFPNSGKIINAGNKINTSYDDFGLVIHPNQTVGYFSSDRPGAGSDDIYRVDFIRLYQEFSGRVVDAITELPIQGALLQLMDCDNKPVGSIRSAVDGSFGFNVVLGQCYYAEASMPGYSPDGKNVTGLTSVELRLMPDPKYRLVVLDTDNDQPVENAIVTCGAENWATNEQGVVIPRFPENGFCSFRVTKNGYLDQTLAIDGSKFKPGTERVDTVWLYKRDVGRTFVLENIYYDFDKWDILPESEIELNKLLTILNDNPTLRVELGSHTDSRGSDSYNRVLSQRRSDSAVGYIINNGIDKSRIVAKGYGESQLVNRCANGVQCTDEEHRKNRRTEFKILGF